MEKKVNIKTSFQQSKTHPTPCSNGCGFFGTSATMNMCSKCYSAHRLKEEQAATVIATAVGRPMSSSTALQHHLAVPEECVESHKEVEIEKVPEVASSKKVANRCVCCNKKVGVMGFKCRCGTTFCGSHRYPEEHMCSFDYKSVGREAIAKANPLVIADRIQRF